MIKKQIKKHKKLIDQILKFGVVAMDFYMY